MKISNKITWLSAGVAMICMTMSACNKPDEIVNSKEGNIYMARAAGNNKLSLLLTDTAQHTYFGASYGGLNFPDKDIDISFKIDSALVSMYNAKNGTQYILLPAFSYQVPALSAVIKAGTTTSNSLPINIITTNLNKSRKYLLPITITSASSGYIDSSLRTTFFTVDTIQRLEKDITSMATLSVSQDNPGGADAGEGSKKLVDNDYNSKFLIAGFNSGFWVQLKFPTPKVIGAYTITSGNDAPDRDLQDWNFAGSNDGVTWTQLDNKVNEIFSGRNLTKRYEINNNTAYTYYRLTVLANGGSNLLQVSEWRLITYP